MKTFALGCLRVAAPEDGRTALQSIWATRPYFWQPLYYADSRKWGVRFPERRVFRGKALDFCHREE